MSNNEILPKFLVLDFDGVLGDITVGSIEACSALTGIPPVHPVWLRYDMHREYGLTTEQYLQAIIDYKILETAIMTPGVRAAIALARACGLQIAVVTARDFHPNKTVTQEWARAHDIHFDHVFLVGASGTKVDAFGTLAKMGEIVGYVDDLPAHLEALRAAGFDFPMYLMNQPWNIDHVGFERVASVPEYVKYVLDRQVADSKNTRAVATI